MGVSGGQSFLDFLTAHGTRCISVKLQMEP